MNDAHRRGVSTAAIHAGAPEPRERDPVVVPIHQSATFFGSGADGSEVRYTRYGTNPNHAELAAKLAALEGTEDAIALASGMAAMSMTVLALTQTGDHIVASEHLYGATKKLLTTEMPKRGVHVDFVDPGVTRAWRGALQDSTRLLIFEVPTNPTLRVFDPRPVAQLARERGLLMVADTTFASPANLRGPDVGIDVVVHSATKYLAGHSDLSAGAVCGSRAVVAEVREKLKLYGPVLDPHASFLLARGIKTLGVRMDRHNGNAAELAAWFEAQPGVSRVAYPGLPSHPDHALAKELLHGYGGMVSVVLEGGGPAADTFMDALELALAAPSLGGVETLVSQPRFTSHVALTPAERDRMGIPDGFVRISVGIEDVDDLRRDFDAALRCANA